MSLVSFLIEEFRVWRHAWSQIETFLDRIDGARGSDERHRKRVAAMLKVVNAIEEEANLRRGRGLLPSLEIDIKRRQGYQWECVQGNFPSPDYDGPMPLIAQRLPGAYEIEMTAGVIYMKQDSQDAPDPKDQVYLDFLPTTPLFDRYSEIDDAWESVAVPRYDFGDWTYTSRGDKDRPHVDDSLFGQDARLQAVISKAPSDSNAKLLKWSELRDKRIHAILESQESFVQHLAEVFHLYQPTGDSTFTSDSLLQNFSEGNAAKVLDLAIQLQAVCAGGVQAMNEALDLLKGDDLGEFAVDKIRKKDFLAELQREAGAMLGRSALYGSLVAAFLGNGQVDFQTYQLLPDFGPYLWPRAVKILDASVDARVAYPGGTMRILRTMEWSLDRLWAYQQPWFDLRRPILSSVLISTFIETFLNNLDLLYRRAATPLPFTGVLAQPAFINGVHLYVHLDQDFDFDDLDPGTVALVQGDRLALAVLLGEDPPPDPPQPSPPPVPTLDVPEAVRSYRRIRIMPLRVSTDAKDPKSTAGIVSARDLMPPRVSTARDPAHALVTAGPITATDDEIKRGTFVGRPQDDGLLQELVALWSRLCLLLGSDAVNLRLSGGLPSFLLLDQKLPVPNAYPVEVNAPRIILKVSELKQAGMDLDAKNLPLIARVGELLLLQGDDAAGSTWQTAIEVISITRTTLDQVDDPTNLNPPGTPICCQGTGEVLVLRFFGHIPVRLEKKIFLHRYFRGFGAASLAAGTILPEVLDPDSWNDYHIYRGPELKAARDLLDRWMWKR